MTRSSPGNGNPRRSRPRPSVEDLFVDALEDSRLALGRLLTVVERGGPAADAISDLAQPRTGRAHILGITGAPGAGKSTLVGELVGRLVASGRRPAVLAVDPSSPLTGGAILGDRIRMDGAAGSSVDVAAGKAPASQMGHAFIRSMATRGHSGGLAVAVPLAVRLFDAVGYDPVIIETVGVGQVEVDVVGAADTAVVVATPGMGDAVQANKAGLLEVADVFVVNKADRPGANDVRRDLELMLDLGHITGQEAPDGYRPPIVMASALEGTGAEDVLDAVSAHLEYLESTGQRLERRRLRVRAEVLARMEQAMARRAVQLVDNAEGVDLLSAAEKGELSPTAVSAKLLEQFG